MWSAFLRFSLAWMVAAVTLLEPTRSTASAERDDAASTKTGPRMLHDPAFRLPDHWILLAVRFDTQDAELVTASSQSVVTVRRWDLAARKLVSEIKLESDEHGRPFRDETVKLSADCRRIIAATDEYVGIWDTMSGKLLKTLPFPTKEWEYDRIGRLVSTPDLSAIVGSLTTSYSRTTLVYDSHTILWDEKLGRIRLITLPRANELVAIALSPDGGRLSTTNGAGAAIWNPRTGDEVLHLPNDNSGRKHPDPQFHREYMDHVWSLQLSPDGKQLAVGDVLGVRLWDMESGKLIRQLEGPYRYSSGSAPRLVFSKNGKLLARLGTKIGEIYTVPIWSTRSGEMLYELQTDAQDGAFSDDGRLFAVGYSDMKMGLAVWQLSGIALEAGRANIPVPESSVNKIAENTHYRGQKAAEFATQYKPVWGDARGGVQYGVGLTKAPGRFRSGERITLAAFVRNASDKPVEIDLQPDYFWDMPTVVNARGDAVEFERVALLGTIPHYRDTLVPGEVFGPLYLNYGLGENPRPGKQNWHPYWKKPVTGKYNLTHSVSIGVAEPGARDEATKWKRDEVTSGKAKFQVVD